MFFLYSYQYLPYQIDPDFSIGRFSISWYSVMYIVAFVVVYFLLRYRIAKNESGEWKAKNDILVDFLLYAFIGLLVGARIGEVLFYNFQYYLNDPVRIISPFDPVTHEFIGIYGLSYHGGLIGVVIASGIWTIKNKINFLDWANFVAPAIPLGYFFGRIGNFINGELYGRVTTKWWGMYFPNDYSLQLRHPSQLYEAISEGLVLFVLLWLIRNKSWAKSNMLAFYLAGYAIARIICEFFREPEKLADVFWGVITTGQMLSLAMLAIAIVLFWKNRKNLV